MKVIFFSFFTKNTCSDLERTARLQSSAVSNQTLYKKQSSGFENMSLIVHIVFYSCLVFLFLIFINCVGNLTSKLSSASSVGSMEESYFLQASLYPSESLSEQRNHFGELFHLEAYDGRFALL